MKKNPGPGEVPRPPSRHLIPTPQHLELRGQELAIRPGCAIATGPRPHPKVALAARMLQEALAQCAPVLRGQVRIAEETAGAAIVLGGELGAAEREALAGTFGQGYVLRTEPGPRVRIAGEPQGILFGAMTLTQLLESDGAGAKVPGVEICDGPDFEFRCAANWLMNGEANRWSMDRGQGWAAFEALCKRKLDQCLRFKINTVLFDGFGWSLARRPAEYPALARRLTAYARARGIALVFGGYGAGYGMEYQKGPLYEDARYLGEVFLNRDAYPDGAIYPCTGETRARSVRKNVDSRVLGTCRSNVELNRLKAHELREFVRQTEPGMVYIHCEDYGGCNTTGAAWQWRCARCRARWPNDDVAAADGAAGAIAAGYAALIEAVNSVRNPDSGYDAARDCQILLVSPVYCLGGPAQTDWDVALRFWQNAGRQLPQVRNAAICFRETFPKETGGGSWTAAFQAAMREAGLPFEVFIFSIAGGDHWLNDYPVTGACALDGIFRGARMIFHDNGDAYQEPQQALNAEYGWNARSTGYAPSPPVFAEAFELWLSLCDNATMPEEIFGPEGLLERICARLYGTAAAKKMARYFTVYRRLQEDAAAAQAGLQDDAPERKAYLPMTWNRIHAVPALWRALTVDSKTWGTEITNERYLQEMEKIPLERRELHRRLARRWELTREMLAAGRDLLREVLALPLAEETRADLRFLCESAEVKLPLAEALAHFHVALYEAQREAPAADRIEASLRKAFTLAECAYTLAREQYPAVIDPVGEAGVTCMYAERLLGAVRERLEAWTPAARSSS